MSPYTRRPWLAELRARYAHPDGAVPSGDLTELLVEVERLYQLLERGRWVTVDSSGLRLTWTASAGARHVGLVTLAGPADLAEAAEGTSALLVLQ